MITIQIILVVGCAVGLTWAMVAWMARSNRREREIIDRRYQEWLANGSNPDDKPNFFSGNIGG